MFRAKIVLYFYEDLEVSNCQRCFNRIFYWLLKIRLWNIKANSILNYTITSCNWEGIICI